MRLNADSHWKRNNRKTRDYLHNKYEVIAVVPTKETYQKAKKYLSKKIKILRYSELEKFVATSPRKRALTTEAYVSLL